MNIKDIHSPADIKGLSATELVDIARQCREALLFKLSQHGGHVGPNLGMVEATIALHYVFDSPVDKIVFDVSHQSYVHKMLTGRVEGFIDPAKFDTISGYTEPNESAHDFFTIGHTSTSITLASGLARARDLRGDKENIIAVIGDGSLSGGQAFEGLDSSALLKSNFIIVVNDNQMSIAENHGGIYDNLRLLRETDGQAPCNLFKAFGLDYMYVKEGNDIQALIEAFQKVKDIDHPVVVHINTQKGKGYAPAEINREKWHWEMPFDRQTGELLHIDESEDYNSITGDYLFKQMGRAPMVVAITAGTPAVMGFDAERRAQAGRQFIDMGIAEQDAVSTASGLAKGGARPFFGVYSSFIQRAYDQLSQDVAINGNPAVFGIFAAGVVGMNDVTHLGWFDIPLISNIPNILYLAPTCKEEYLSMLDWAMKQNMQPVAIRVPGGRVVSAPDRTFPTDYSNVTAEVVKEGSKVAIIGVGDFFPMAQKVAEILKESGIDATVINPRYVSGLDKELLENIKKNHSLVITLESGILDGGYGQKIDGFYADCDTVKVLNYGVPKKFLDRYNISELLTELHLSPELIAKDIKDQIK